MTRLAFEGRSGIAVSDIEIRRGGPTYTIDTVTELEQHDAEVLLVVGPTAASGMATWHRAEELARRVTLAVVQPPGSPPVQVPGWRTCAVHMAPVEASATLVRELLARRGGLEQPLESARLVPPQVMSYLIEHNLYSP